MIRRNRNWVILYQLGEGNVWAQVTAISAPTRKAAVMEATKGDKNPYPAGTFKAVDAKEWGRARPITVPDEDAL